MGRPTKNLEGTVFGDWSVVSQNKTRLRNGGITYKCVCKCGTVKNIQGSALRYGSTTGCRSCASEKISKSLRGRPSPTRLPDGESTLNTTYSNYKRRAEQRGYPFELPKETFFKMLQGDCYYCGSPPSNIMFKGTYRELVYNGVDRVDNTKGYTVDNTVSCCKFCNRAKDVNTEEEFIDKVKKIYYRHVIQDDIAKIDMNYPVGNDT